MVCGSTAGSSITDPDARESAVRTPEPAAVVTPVPAASPKRVSLEAEFDRFAEREEDFEASFASKANESSRTFASESLSAAWRAS
jgi:hypothetical protein